MSRISAVRSIDLELHPKKTFEIRLLGRTQLVVEHDYVGIKRLSKLFEFLNLAAPQKRLGNRVVEPLGEPAYGNRSGRFRKATELVEGRVDGPISCPCVYTDQDAGLRGYIGRNWSFRWQANHSDSL